MAAGTGDFGFLVVSDGEASDAEVWIANYDGEWTRVPTSLPALLDTILSDTDSWGAPQFTPMEG